MRRFLLDTSPLPPPGWYPDPFGGPAVRYWHGTNWTPQSAPPPARGHPIATGLGIAAAVVACIVQYMLYNFARPHQTLTKDNGGKKTTPAMAAGVTNRVWTHRDIAALLDD